jgi:hypothetical protein
MQLRIPTIEIKSRRVNLPEFDAPKAEAPRFELPHIELPKVDLPKVELPKFDLHRPDISTPDLGKTGKAIGASLESVGDRLGSLATDVRSVRVTRKPEPNVAAPAGLALLGGLGGGMALMFFFDPRQGRRRRALLRDQLVRLANSLSRAVSGGARSVQGRGAGLAASVRPGTGSSSTDDGAAVVAETPYAADQLEATDEAAASSAAATGSDDASADVASGGWDAAGNGHDAATSGTETWDSAETAASIESSQYGSATGFGIESGEQRDPASSRSDG